MPTRFRYLSLALFGLSFLLAPLGHAQKIATATNSASATPPDPASQAIAEAMLKIDANDVDGALAKLTDAIKANPKISGPYMFRASLYCQKKMWTEAEQDFEAAAKISPKNIVIKFNVVEVKFMQKQYDAARPGYLALETDPDMGDLAAYKVFLCDLLGGHEALARKELDVFNKVNDNPSYYFGNAAWDLVHQKVEDARSWLTSAAYIYPSGKIAYYATCLRDLGYLPLPPPPAPAK